jgi:hypothetical protein
MGHVGSTYLPAVSNGLRCYHCHKVLPSHGKLALASAGFAQGN